MRQFYFELTSMCKRYVKRPSVWILLGTLILLMLLAIVVIPGFTFYRNGTNLFLPYYIGNAFCYILILFAGFISLFSNMTFDISDATFKLSRAVPRVSYFAAKICFQLIVLFNLVLFIFIFWIIADKAFFPNRVSDPSLAYATLFCNGFTLSATIVPFLLVGVAVIFANASLKWFNKAWLTPTIFTFLTLLITIPYLMFGQFQHDGIMEFSKYVRNATLVIPAVVFAFVIACAGVSLFTTIKFMKVRV